MSQLLRPQAGSPPLPPPSNVPSPWAVPAQPVPCPARAQTLGAFPTPFLALLPSKRNRLHLALLPRRPRAAGARPREWVCVGACGHIAAPTEPRLGKGGATGSRPSRVGLQGSEHTAREPARPECALGLAACLLADRGHLNLSLSSGKWVHSGPCLSGRILWGTEGRVQDGSSGLGELQHLQGGGRHDPYGAAGPAAPATGRLFSADCT